MQLSAIFTGGYWLFAIISAQHFRFSNSDVHISFRRTNAEAASNGKGLCKLKFIRIHRNTVVAENMRNLKNLYNEFNSYKIY